MNRQQPAERPGHLRNPVAPLFLLAVVLLTPACDLAPEAGVDEERFQQLRAEMEERFTPGLHSLMVDMGMRHASLWFAGEAANWELADYMVHEFEELVEEIEELHPVYHEIEVAEMLGEMTLPAVEALEDAVEARDGMGFERAYDQLTTACNACHIAADRAAIVIQRPTHPPLTNLRFRP